MLADFEELVDLYYPSLYRFALSLCRQESDACDLTQETFYIFAEKHLQVREPAKVKSWLFTTLHRQFLARQRKILRFPQTELSQAEGELPEVPPPNPAMLDSSTVLEALNRLDPPFRAAVALFYLEDYSHPEIAEILQVPIGTVKSRISRGVAQLQKSLLKKEPALQERGAL